MTKISRYTPDLIHTYVDAGYWTPERTVDYWYRNAQSRPNEAAIADDCVTLSWVEGVRIIDSIAAGLANAGVPRDAVLLVQAPNSARLVLFRLACESAGVIPAYLLMGFRRSEIEAVAKKVHPAGAVIAAEGKYNLMPLYKELRASLGLRHFFTLEPSTTGAPSIAGLAATPARSRVGERGIRPYELTGIVTSSGTTGLPKCIEQSCSPRLASARVYIERLKITERDVVLICIPVYTGMGDMLFHATPQTGTKFIVLPQFAPDATCGVIERERVTGAMMVPTMIVRITGLKNLHKYDFSNLRWVVSSGSMLPYDIGARFEDATGAKIIQGYGLMESGALSGHGVDDPREMRLRSNGRPIPGTDLRVLDQAGRPVPPGAVGEICACGPHCVGGYIGDSEGMHAAWRNGFFHTGDLGRVTPDGYLVLEGRSKDIIIRGGQNISAPEVETILCRHSAVADAAVVRMPDHDMGERACAFVVLRPGESLDFDSLVAFMKTQEVANYKIPERLEIISEFPMTVTGYKVDKRALEARLRDLAVKAKK